MDDLFFSRLQWAAGSMEPALRTGAGRWLVQQGPSRDEQRDARKDHESRPEPQTNESMLVGGWRIE